MTALPTAPLPPPPRATRTPMASGAAFGLLYRTFLRSARTRGRIVCLLILAGFALLRAATAGTADGLSLDRGLDVAGTITTQIVAIGALVIASAVLGDLYDNGSIVYVVLRPVPNGIVAAAAWAAACTIVAPMAVLASLAVAIVHGGDGLVAASLLAAVIGTLAYAALFGLLGVLVRRALPTGIAYLVLWEGFVSFAGNAGAAVSISGYLRSILARITGGEVDAAPFVLASGILVPLAVTAAAIWATGRLLDRRELP